MQQTTDSSKDFFNELHLIRLNVIKEVFEILGCDLGESESNVVYHNYMDYGFPGNELISDTFSDVLSEVDFSNYEGKFVSVEELLKIFPKANKNYVAAAVLALDKYGDKVGLNNIGKLMVLGQFAHESGYFQFTHELGYGKGQPYGIPTGPYGKVYYGRGPIQITWETNYKQITQNCFPKLGISADIHKDPDLCCKNLEIGCAASLCWFMLPGNGKRAIAAANSGNIKELTKAINGGYNGLQDRINNTRKILNLTLHK